MSTVYRVRVAAQGIGGGRWVSNLHFLESAGSAAQAHAAVVAFYTALKVRMSSTVQMTVEGDVALIDTASGLITGVTAVPAVNLVGASGGSPAALATQGLIRFTTGAYIGGRQIRGRLFVWGITQADESNGGVNPAAVLAWEAAGNTLLSDANADLVVYSKKNGTQATAVAVSAWSSFAVLRSRRD